MLSDDRPTDPAWLPIFSKKEHFMGNAFEQRGGRQRKVPFQSLLTSGHIDPKWRKLKGRHLLGAVF